MTILRGFPTSLLILGLFASVIGVTEAAAQSQPSSRQVAQEVKVTLLSTNLADVPGVGEWGLSALVEVDGEIFSKNNFVLHRSFLARTLNG